MRHLKRKPMKTTFQIIIALLIVKGYAQDPQLAENTWYLSYFTKNNATIIPPANDEIPYVPAEFTEFGNWNFSTGACDAVGSGEILYSGNSQFTFDNLAFLAGGCSAPMNSYFAQQYVEFWVYDQAPPYFYNIIQNQNALTLTITNPIGDIAVFGNQLLSSVEYNIELIALFPNPVHENLTIKSPKKPSKISLYDITGKLMKHYNFVEGDNNIDMQTFQPGVYMLIFEINETKVVKKIVKL